MNGATVATEHERTDELAGVTSAIWQGSVRHRRFAPRAHAFSYSLFMLGLDLDELPQLDQGRWFGVERSGLLSFHRHDYLKGSEGSLKQAVWQKVGELGGDAEPEGRVLLLGNVRCLGFYFSPVNFYFCYRQGEARYLLAEVSNTPGTSVTTTCWIWRRWHPMTRIFTSPLYGAGDALSLADQAARTGDTDPYRESSRIR